jgi:E3 ubiquitin-protein ligase UBR1
MYCVIVIVCVCVCLLQHVRACSNGNGIFLLLSSSVVLLLTGNDRGCVWGTCYIDQHGEEDIGVRRGRPLSLDRERLELLRSTFLQANVATVCQAATQQLVGGRSWLSL